MIAISAQHVQKAFGVNTVLKDVTFSIQQGDRIGLVGVNGSGKSTLMKILAGLEPEDGGELSIQKGIRTGYLAQQNMVAEGTSVWETLKEIYNPVFRMEERLRMMEEEMAAAHSDPKRFDQLSGDYDRLTRQFEESGGYAWNSMITGVLNGLGFKETDYERDVRSLSGGEQTRLCLARLLLLKPDLLLLDEPTNHLDMAALSWLENTLSSYRGTVMVISHDRYFLDHVCNGIIELLMGTAEQYSGNYTQYIAKRQERYETRMRSYELQQKEIERQQAIIARYRMFNREKSIRAAESREKALSRMEILEKPEDEQTIRLQFEAGKRTGEDVLYAVNLSKGYGDKRLFQDVDLHVRAGDRVAIIGPNGIGKTTLLRVLTGEEKPETGEVRLGANVQIGYYDQQQAGLHNDKTILDEVWDRFPQMDQDKVRGALGMFLFTGDEVFQRIGTLSGGEKGRVALTILMLRHDNLLILDEPTNHLDMDSREALEEALSQFGGTIITVSHDRYFINRVAGEILEMTDGGISRYLGNYDDYMEKKNAPTERPEAAGKTRTLMEKEKRRDRESRMAAKKLKEQAQNAERAVAAKEQEIEEMETRLADPALYTDRGQAAAVQKKYQEAKEKLTELYAAWEAAEEALSEAEA